MAISKKERQVIENVLDRLKGNGNAAPSVKEALTGDCGVYLSTWIIPALEILIGEGHRDLDLAVSLTGKG